MSWKKTSAFFFLQAVRFAPNWDRFKEFMAYYSRWTRFQANGRTALDDALPWLNFPALDYIEDFIEPNFKVFEFGGGGSSLFFCKRVAEVITVEHDPKWFSKLKRRVAEKGYRNWQGILQTPELLPNSKPLNPEDPMNFMSPNPAYSGLSFEKYARQIERFPKNYCDLILVDGRARPSCIQLAIPRLRENGLLVVDNTERDYYLADFKKAAIQNFSTKSDYMAPIAYSPDFVKTSVFKKLAVHP